MARASNKNMIKIILNYLIGGLFGRKHVCEVCNKIVFCKDVWDYDPECDTSFCRKCYKEWNFAFCAISSFSRPNNSTWDKHTLSGWTDYSKRWKKLND